MALKGTIIRNALEVSKYSVSAPWRSRSKILIQNNRLSPVWELSRKAGLIVRVVGPGTVERLFAEIEKYDSHERAETFEYLRRALHETRSSLSSEDVYLDK